MLLLDDEKLLKRDFLANISMLGFFAKHKPTRILRKGESLMAQGKSDEDWWYLSLKDLSVFDWFIELTGSNDRYLAAIDDSILEYVNSRFTCKWVLSCQRLYLPNEVSLTSSFINISSAVISDAEHIYAHSDYKAYISIEYIEEQIMQGPSSAYRIGDELVGWALTHDDGAMGMLHVLDKYRRKGIARAVVVDLIERVRSLGLTPFTYVESSNNASMGLVKSLGFVPDRPIHWVCIDR